MSRKNRSGYSTTSARTAIVTSPRLRLMVFTLVLLLGLGCQTNGDRQTEAMSRAPLTERGIPELDDIDINNIVGLDPLALVREQAVRDDMRFLGVSGLGLSFPGLPNNVASLVGKDQQNFVLMKGTSDVSTSRQEEIAIVRGRAFAHQYNSALLDYIGMPEIPESVDDKNSDE